MAKLIFEDCVFFLKVKLSFKEKKQLKSNIITNGGTISFVLNQKCSHVIVSNSGALRPADLKKIQKFQIEVVDIHSVWTSIEDQEKLTKNNFGDVDEPERILKETLKNTKNKDYLKNIPSTKTLKVQEETHERFVDEDDDANMANFTQHAEVAKYCFLQMGTKLAIVELLCSQEGRPFPFRIYTRLKSPNESLTVSTYEFDSMEKACEKYKICINNLKHNGFILNDEFPPEAVSFASEALQKVLLVEAINTTQLTPEVGYFVECIWVDALGHLDNVLSCPVNQISLNDVSKAEGILLQVRNALDTKEKPYNIMQMMSEFYRLIPHKPGLHHKTDKKLLSAKQDLCQLIRDMVNVCETNLYKCKSSSIAKYQALKCRIDYVDPNTEEFLQVKQQVLEKNHSEKSAKILNIYKIGRLSEATEFQSKIGNIKPLLHASSACNFVGILSRGLLLPKAIVEEHGFKRTDIGNLGSGIYFSDSISTSFKYTEPSTSNGSRLLVVCDVALGTSQKRYERDFSITDAPNGFHSIHGVQQAPGMMSDFEDDEFVVYNRNQVKLRYIVQFCSSEDELNMNLESFSFVNEETEENFEENQLQQDETILEDLPEKKDIKGGLQSSQGVQIPLTAVHVKARMMDLIIQVVVFQTYKNTFSYPIEAKYVFPLDSTAAVCGFEAYINGKHIVGEVKEKKQAHQEYRAAISEGHGAYLMDQDAPDVFTVSVGNLPPSATVIIKITYIEELEFKYGAVNFTIPGTLASWQQENALKENTQDTVTKVCVEEGEIAKADFCLDMSIEMPYVIEQISSYTHDIKVKKTDCKAVIQIEKCTLDTSGFFLEVSMKDEYLPRMWVERHPDQDSEACMLVFQPKFERNPESGDITICLDCSNSMEPSFQDAKLLALLTIRLLHFKHKLNLITFGTRYKEFDFYPKSHASNLSQLEEFIKSAKPNMGSTEFWKPLHSLSLLVPSSGMQNILLISDGHIQNESPVIQILKENVGKIRLFTFGVGVTTNRHMLRCLSQQGSGACEFFEATSKSTWEKKLATQEERLESPACNSISVKWRNFNVNAPEPIQAPTHIQALFCDERLLVYGFVPDCSQATLKAFINNQELDTMVSTTELQKTTGTMLHKLTARAIIRDYEDGMLHENEDKHEMKKQQLKSLIIELSKNYSIVTQFTSFVAVEKRDSRESEYNQEVNVLEIIAGEDVDLLPYMDWEVSVSDVDITEETCDNEEQEKSINIIKFKSEPLTLPPPPAPLLSTTIMAAASSCTGKDSDDPPELQADLLMETDRLEDDQICNRVSVFTIRNKLPLHAETGMTWQKTSQRSLVNKLESNGFESCKPGMSLGMSFKPEPSTLPPPPPPVPRSHSSLKAAEFSFTRIDNDEPPKPSAKLFMETERLEDSSVYKNQSDFRIMSKIISSDDTGMTWQKTPHLSPVSQSMPSRMQFNGFGRSIPKMSLGMSFKPEPSTLPPPPPPVPRSHSSLKAAEVSFTRKDNDEPPKPSAKLFMETERLEDSSVYKNQSDLRIMSKIISSDDTGMTWQKTPHLTPVSQSVPSRMQFNGFGSSIPKMSLGMSFKPEPSTLPPPPPPVPRSHSSLKAAEVSFTRIDNDEPPEPSAKLFMETERLEDSSVYKNESDFRIMSKIISSDDTGMTWQKTPHLTPVSQSVPSRMQFNGFGSSIPKMPSLLKKKKQMSPGFSSGSAVGQFQSSLFQQDNKKSSGFSAGFSAGQLKDSFFQQDKQTASEFSTGFSVGQFKNSLFQQDKQKAPGFSPSFSVAHLQDTVFQKEKQTSPGFSSGFSLQQLQLSLLKTQFISVWSNMDILMESVKWESLAALQCQEGYWMMTPALGQLLNLDVNYIMDVWLFKKGICSLGAKGRKEVLNLIATLLVLQIIRTLDFLDLIVFKSLLKLHESSSTSPFYQDIEKAIKWARKADQQHTGICMRLNLGKDWDSVTRTILQI